MRNFTFIDLFSGAGGLLSGFKKAEFQPLFSVEKWEPAIKTHHRNYPNIKLVEKDIKEISNEEIKSLVGQDDVDVIIGGPPCQGFSSIGKRIEKDPRNELVFEFIRFIDVVKPKFFLMENVKGLLSSNKGKLREQLEEEFKRIGYKNTISEVLNAADFGVPQTRQRVFFMGTRLDLDISFPNPTHNKESYRTVGETIMDLVGKENTFPNHIPMNHNKIVKERFKYIPEGKGIPSEGVPDEVLYGSRSDFKDKKIKNFSHIYKRLNRKEPSGTMVPGHNAFPIHPTEDRALTVREAARIQTFDDEIIFEGSRQDQCIQVGNAVPVNLAFHLAMHIKGYLE